MLLSQCLLRGEIYDCFTFYNELELLKVRLEELYDDVDHFVIVEATETFSGLSKPLYFLENVQLFEQYQDKIIYVVVDDFPPPSDDPAGDRWIREGLQRDAMMRGLGSCSADDIILISDLDEIPSRSSLKEISQFYQKRTSLSNRLKSARNAKKAQENQLICSLEMRMFLFYLNRTSPLLWVGGAKALPFWLLEKRTPWEVKMLHNFDFNLPRIKSAGWHFHSMGGQARVAEKLEAIYLYDELSFLHPYELKQVSPSLVPFYVDGLTEQEWPDSIEISQNPDLFIAWTEVVQGVESVDIDTSFPIYIQEHIQEFQSLGWIHGM